MYIYIHIHTYNMYIYICIFTYIYCNTFSHNKTMGFSHSKIKQCIIYPNLLRNVIVRLSQPQSGDGQGQ